jgi:hypothetical protein
LVRLRQYLTLQISHNAAHNKAIKAVFPLTFHMNKANRGVNSKLAFRTSGHPNLRHSPSSWSMTNVLLLCFILVAGVNIWFFGDFLKAGVAAVKAKLVESRNIVLLPSIETNVREQTRELVEGEETRKKYAYVTLISGLDKTYRYRGFLYNAMIMNYALKSFGSTADFVAMIGLNDPIRDAQEFAEDFELLRSHGIIVHILDRLIDYTIPSNYKLSFAEMALLKVTPWSFTQYSRVQFMDGDVLPTANMDCYFNLHKNTFTVGKVSPLNSGWYLAIPDMEAYNYMKDAVRWSHEKCCGVFECYCGWVSALNHRTL